MEKTKREGDPTVAGAVHSIGNGRGVEMQIDVSEDLDGSVREDVYQYGVDLTKRIGEAFTLARESQEKSDAARKKQSTCCSG